MKKNKLYTINEWNKPQFSQKGNLFALGDSMLTTQDPNKFFGGNANFSGYNQSFNAGSGLNFNAGKALGSIGSSGSGGFNFGSLFGGFGGSGGAGGSGGPSTGGSLMGAIPGIATGIMAGMQDRPQYSADAYNGFSTVDTALTQGKKSKVGTSLVNAGASWMNSALKSGNPKDMFWAGVVGTVGTIINNGWGIGVDEKKLKAVNESIDNYNNFESRASSLDDIVMPTAGVTNTDLYTGGVFTKDEAAEENRRLKKRLSDARAFAYNGVGNNIFNITTDKQDSDLARYAAYGGPIGDFSSSALGIMQNDKFLRSMDYRSDALANKNTNLGLGAFTGGAKTFDDGGQLSAAFVDDFSTDPIGAAVRYNQGLERMQAEKEAAVVEAQREAEYAAMQQRLANLETQNQGLQAIMAAQSQASSLPEIPEIPETLESSSSTSEAAQGSGNKTWDYIENELRKSGKFNDIQIQGIKYNLQRESSIDPTVVGDGGAAFGLGQWHGSRKPKDMSLEGQTRHLIDTMSNFDGKKHWVNKKDYEGFLNARTPEEAHYYLAKGYERPRADIVAKVKRYSDMSLSRLKAFGGELGTNGTDWTNGLLYIDEGGSHEENPFDGVPMGVDAEGIPNLVEEGETVYNNYVFSDRMNVPDFMYKELGLGGVIKKGGKGMSFADASKKLAQESEQRPNDPISQAGLEASLSKLAEVQEAERMRKQAEEYMGLEYACGGKMHKYGLGGNMFDDGGALEWINKEHPNLSEHQRKQIASVMQKRIDRKYPNGRKDVNYETFYNNLAPFFGTEKNLEESYRALVADGMLPNVALNVLARSVDGSSGRIQNKDKWVERYKKWNTGTSSSKPSVQQSAKAASTQQAAQQQTPQTTTATTTTATPAQGSSGGVGKKSAASTDNSSNRNFGQEADIADRIAFDPRMDEVRKMEGFGQPSEIKRDEAFRRGALGEYTPEISPKDAGLIDMATGVQQEKVPQYDTWIRYAPVFGAGLMSMTDLLGITNKPDYTYVDRLAAAADRAGYAPHIEAEPIGNYLTYNPMDIWYQQNALNAQSRATDRALLNSNSPSRAAGLLANGYNSQLASGNLYRQALEYNDAKKQTVEDFNRKTNMFNSQMKLEADMANARYHQQAQQFGLSGLAQAAALRDQIDSRTGAAKSANLSNFFTSLGNIGRENFAMNQINNSRAAHNGYYGDLSGRVKHDNHPSAYGGKIKKRK